MALAQRIATKIRFLIIPIAGISLVLLAGCQRSTPAPTITPSPSPSRTVQILFATTAPPPIPVAQPSRTPSPLPTATETSLPAWVTVVAPTDGQDGAGTPDPAAQGTNPAGPGQSRPGYPTFTPPPPSAQLNIQRPGPYSKVISPIELRAAIHPGDDKMLYLELIGEDGRVITSQNYNFSLASEYWVYTIQEIPFTIDAFSEMARLVLYTLDRFNRKIYQVSVDLILIQLGDDSINLPVVEDEPYLIRKPWEGATVRGGVMEVEGLIRPLNDQPLIVEIIDEDGNLVASAQAEVDQPSALQPYVPIKLSMPYSVSKWTRVRLSARQESANRIPGTVWLTSFLMYLEP